MKENIEKIKELLASEEFGNEVKDYETEEELQAAFARHGVELSVEDVRAICAQVYVANGGELSDEELDDVAGGFALTGALLLAGAVVLSYGVGYVAGKIVKKKSGICR